MAKRRSNGEGTLRQRPNGLWELTLMDGFQSDGRRKYKSFYAKTQKEVKQKARAYQDAKAEGIEVDVVYYFDEWADLWFESHKDNIMPPHRKTINTRCVSSRPRSHTRRSATSNPLTLR